MKKTDKKTENAIRIALTNVCDVALDEVPGFQWITHFVNYDNLPGSLIVVCVFATKSELSSALSAHHDDFLRTLITSKLRAANIQCKNSQQFVRFDSEETWEPEKYRLH
ncbi:Fis family transcriptional regulator [Neptunomonas japonica]|uniref:Fis family transcriptional regulator n=1 Tax=Neptunomonas japonica JAMM 1380 TaxID=1441457 RepID=A0A7R6PG20_9GAMM|nr:Fis family transcriptional regulator [Neptunomonas japonica]BBB29497.1 Fis family transcriptional regulator [Neptunomonas japonica JAMM 1380]